MAMQIEERKQRTNIVIVGHVDHGKSTIIGRLLADTQSLPEGKLEQVKGYCERNSKPFEYAFLIDALKEEQAQGITIESARVFFKHHDHYYIIIDAPGHIEFLKNMITGASRAQAALLVIDALEGIQENSRRHGYMISLLGIRQVIVLINKMDLVAYRKEVFQNVVNDYSQFLARIDINPIGFVPVSGVGGDNIALKSKEMPWYEGHTVLEFLDALKKEDPLFHKPFRMPVQDVYKFTNFGDTRRIIAGTTDAGSIRAGEEVIFYPSGRKGRIKNIEVFGGPAPEELMAGGTAGFTLTEQIYVTRGEIATQAGGPRPKVTSRLRVSLFWLGKEPMTRQKDYFLKIGTAKVPLRIERIQRVIDTSTLSPIDQTDTIERNQVAECILKLNRAIAFDLANEIPSTGRFVIVDDYEIRGGGIILEDLEDNQAWVRDKLFLRDYKWEKSSISWDQRAERYNQKATLVLVTGERNSGKKPFARSLESRLFNEGKWVYFLGIGNVLYGLDADIKSAKDNRQEHLRRLAEVAHILLDAGMILIVTAIELTEEDLDLIAPIINPDRIQIIWVGENVSTDIVYDMKVSPTEDLEKSVDAVKAMLQERGIIFRPN
jgi:bifunctional enzyme CysN/CysC